MATVPTTEDAAKHILAIFLSSGAKPGDVLPLARVIRAFSRAPWRQADIAPGLDFAIERGWIDETDTPPCFG